jgi:spore germination protein KB
MKVETISDKQGIFTMVLLLLGANFILGTAGAAKKDAWLAILIGMLAAQIMLAVYARILSLYPQKDVLEINELIFGKFLGKLINIAYTMFAIYLGARVLYNLSQFIIIVGLPGTPVVVPLLFIVILCIWLVKEGIEVIGRCSQLFAIVVFTSFIITTLLSIPEMKPHYIRPVLYGGLKPVFKGAITAFFFPFTDNMIFLMVFKSLIDNKSPYRIYFKGSLISGMILIIAAARNIMVVGVEEISRNYFSSYIVASRIHIGDFLQRVELIVMIVIVLAVFIKASCCLLAAAKGVASVLGFKDYRFITSPVVLATAALSYKLFENMSESVNWIQLYMPLYNSIFTVGIVILTYVRAEFYHRRKFKTGTN